MEVINIETEAQAEKGAINCNWAVCYTIDHTAKGCQQDDGRDKVRTIATFENPTNAEDFIKILPQETRERFYIVRIRNNYPENIRKKYFE